MRSVFVRHLSLLLVFSGATFAQTESRHFDRLAAVLNESFSYSPPAPISVSLASSDESESVPEEEPVLQLETFRVAASIFHRDLLDAARRAADLRNAKNFSLLGGGLILSKRFGPAQLDLGAWFHLEPHAVDALGYREEVMLRMDLLRLTW